VADWRCDSGGGDGLEEPTLEEATKEEATEPTGRGQIRRGIGNEHFFLYNNYNNYIILLIKAKFEIYE
jgi:hypothetical protein